MLRAMLCDLRAHKGRIAMTLVAIVLGVAFVVSTWVLSDSTAASLTTQNPRSTVDISVQSPPHNPLLTEENVVNLAALPGVRKATGIRTAPASLVGASGKIIPGAHAEAGTSWDTTDRFTLTTGTAPSTAKTLALSEEAARSANLHAGDEARVILANGKEIRATVVGLFDYRTLGVEISPSVAFPTTTAAELSHTYDRIELQGTHLRTTTIRATIPNPSIKIRTGKDLAAEADTEAADAAESTRESLLAFAAVALLVGMFVIANTFTMLVTQRVRQFALLRAVGATRRQVRRAVLLEAAALGAVGGTLGVAAGIALGLLGMQTFTPADKHVTYVVSPTAILVGYAVGIGVTTAAAYASARRAAAVPPMAALRADATPPRHTTAIRTVAGALLLTGGATTVAFLTDTTLSTTERIVCMAGGVAAWLGVLLLAPTIATTALTPVARFLTRRGPVPRLATRNAVRDPRRTAATSSALLVGLALVCAFATLGETVVSISGAAVRTMVPETTTIIRPASDSDPLTTDVLTQARTTPGVTAVAADRYTLLTATHNGEKTATSLSAIEPDGFTNVLTPTVVAGTPDLHKGIVVDTNQAAMMNATLGDELTLNFPNAPAVRQRITGLIETVEGQPLIYLNVARAPKWLQTQATSIYATGPAPEAARKALTATFRARPDVLITTREEAIAAAAKSFESILVAMYAMFGAAIVIAIFGVINTLALSVTERTQELGILRAIGASRTLIRRTVRLESIIICTYGGALGIAVGILFGAIMQHAMLGNALLNIEIPTAVIAISLAGMLAVGVLSAAWPARRAARTDVLSAITTS
jgi:putative ABC transport system permease protein